MASNNGRSYDAAVGGRVSTRPTLSSYGYASEALNELIALRDMTLNALQNGAGDGRKLIFQGLPVHMRRRAMSHHPNRLPRKYRNAHIAQMRKAGGDNNAKPKRPSRRYRRRVPCLLRNMRHQPNSGEPRVSYLSTHRWHAKRFAMIKRWGWRLPYCGNTKNYRRSIRALKNGCLLQDISYWRLLQVRGDGVALCNRLKLILRGIYDRYKVRAIAGEKEMNGEIEYECHLNKIDMYPFGALQRARFMWRPPQEETDGLRTLWLWLHPSTYKVVRKEIAKLLQLKRASKKRGSKMHGPLHFVHAEQQYEMSELSGTFNRFRLSGPKAHEILTRALNSINFKLEAKKRNWLRDWYNPVIRPYAANELGKSGGFLLNGAVMSLVVEDPRLYCSGKPEFICPGSQVAMYRRFIDQSIYKKQMHLGSILWQQNELRKVCESMVKPLAYNEWRAKHVVVPGTTIKNLRGLQPVPLLIVRRAYLGPDLGGYDIILPACYSMAFWLTFVMHGAVVGGLRESKTIERETGRVEQPPDTLSARIDSNDDKKRAQEKYFRLPPNKRTNYRRYQVPTPFAYDFGRVALERSRYPEDARGGSAKQLTDFCVVRDHKVLKAIHHESIKRSEGNLLNPLNWAKQSLIQVRLRMLQGGTALKLAMICWPTQSEIDFYNENGMIKNESLIVPTVKDENRKIRRDLRKAHKLKVKRLRARRVREKLKAQAVSNKKIHIAKPNITALKLNFASKIKKLWMPEWPKSGIIENRPIIGYVTNGGFSYIQGTGTAIGYVSADFLFVNTYNKHHEYLVLVRNPNSIVNYYAAMELELEPY